MTSADIQLALEAAQKNRRREWDCSMNLKAEGDALSQATRCRPPRENPVPTLDNNIDLTRRIFGCETTFAITSPEVERSAVMWAKPKALRCAKHAERRMEDKSV